MNMNPELLKSLQSVWLMEQIIDLKPKLFKSLPYELVEKIFDYLPIEDYNNINLLVNKQLNHVLSKTFFSNWMQWMHNNYKCL